MRGCTLLMYTWQIKGNYIHGVGHRVNNTHGVVHAEITIFIVTE